MKSVKLIFAVAILLLFSGCGTVFETTIDKGTKSMQEDYTIVASGSYPADMALYHEGEAIAKSFRSDVPAQKEAFATLYERITAQKAPAFEGTMVVVMMGTQFTGGYGYEIAAITKSADASALTLKKITPSGLVTEALTNPYLILSLPGSYANTKITIE